MLGCKNISSDPDCIFPMFCSADLDYSLYLINTTYPIEFNMCAVNGAGRGRAAYAVYQNFTFLYKTGPHNMCSIHLIFCSKIVHYMWYNLDIHLLRAAKRYAKLYVKLYVKLYAIF